MKKIITLTIAIFICSGIITGCFDRREIDDQTYVVALGLDVGKIDPIRITMQYALPTAMGSGGGGSEGGGKGNKNVNTITLDAATLNAGILVSNQVIAKRINMSHAVLLVISEDLAKKGINSYIYAMARGREYRPGMFVAVCKGRAEDYINAINPIQEYDPSKFYQLLYSNYRYTGLAPNIEFYKFYDSMQSISNQPLAILASTSRYKSSDEFKAKNSSAGAKDRYIPYEGDFKAGDIPKVGDQNGEIMGLAVFNGSKMIGEMDGEEARNYLMVTGKYGSSNVSIPDPRAKGKFLVFNIKQSRKPSYKINLGDSGSKIDLNVRLEVDLATIQSGINYESQELMPIVEKASEKFVRESIIQFLNRTTHEFNSDICGFGTEARKQFLTYNDWENYHWLDKYKNSEFNVNVDVKIRRPGLLIRTNPTISTNEEDKPGGLH